ncbi:OadG family protein [Campylobacter sp. faydin G-24]|uniref:OadG family protein n=1 Tax=Campylobacter anatolicus TaxID=2829105 RepID=A0ABS5HG60_9BACT|nr:OadG family protein [Campylobacter anatolicus]MBR8462486.1 OadG family protein [Campylobacter anatolicus]MBR8463082.1 OadG family protein [Campylobacter anatolicus]
MEINLVAEGFRFMVLGMLSVFVFLVLMVFVLKMQGVILKKFFKEPIKLQISPTQTNTDNNELVAVIGAAITEFEKSKI